MIFKKIEKERERENIVEFVGSKKKNPNKVHQIEYSAVMIKIVKWIERRRKRECFKNKSKVMFCYCSI